MGYHFPIHQHDTWGRIKAGKEMPTDAQVTIMETVEKALDAGLHYCEDVYQFVIANVPEGFFTAEDLALNFEGAKVERGLAGMEIYYAREIVDARRRLEANMEAVKSIEVGTVIKDRYCGGHKFFKLIVEETTQDGRVTLLCTKRGTRNKWRTTLEAIHPVFRPEPDLKGATQVELTMDRHGYMEARALA